MIHQIERFLDDVIRPVLAQHQGNVELVDVDNNKVFIKFHGGCHGCSSSKATLQGGIETQLKEHFPEIDEVIDVTDHAAGTNPYLK